MSYQNALGQPDLVYHSLCLVLSDREEQVAWETFTGEDWRLFAQTAQAEGVAPLVYWTFRAQGRPDHCPTTVYRSLATISYQSLARNTLLHRGLECILRALDQAGIPVILLKDAALAPGCTPFRR